MCGGGVWGYGGEGEGVLRDWFPFSLSEFGAHDSLCVDVRPRTSNICKGLAKATREDVVIFGAICGSILTARDPLFGLLGV